MDDADKISIIKTERSYLVGLPLSNIRKLGSSLFKLKDLDSLSKEEIIEIMISIKEKLQKGEEPDSPGKVIEALQRKKYEKMKKSQLRKKCDDLGIYNTIFDTEDHLINKILERDEIRDIKNLLIEYNLPTTGTFNEMKQRLKDFFHQKPTRLSPQKFQGSTPSKSVTRSFQGSTISSNKILKKICSKSPSRDKYKDASYQGLQKIATNYGLDTRGNKSTLINRIYEYEKRQYRFECETDIEWSGSESETDDDEIVPDDLVLLFASTHKTMTIEELSKVVDDKEIRDYAELEGITNIDQKSILQLLKEIVSIEKMKNPVLSINQQSITTTPARIPTIPKKLLVQSPIKKRQLSDECKSRTMPELKELAADLGIPKYKSMKKLQLCDAIEAIGGFGGPSSLRPSSVIVSSPKKPVLSKRLLSDECKSRTMPELKVIASSLGIGIRKKKKLELCSDIEAVGGFSGGIVVQPKPISPKLSTKRQLSYECKSLTMPKLQALAGKLGLSGYKGKRKLELCNMIEAVGGFEKQPSSSKPVSAKTSPLIPLTPKRQLSDECKSRTMPELKELAAALGIPKYKSMKKLQLCDAIEAIGGFGTIDEEEEIPSMASMGIQADLSNTGLATPRSVSMKKSGGDTNIFNPKSTSTPTKKTIQPGLERKCLSYELDELKEIASGMNIDHKGLDKSELCKAIEKGLEDGFSICDDYVPDALVLYLTGTINLMTVSELAKVVRNYDLYEYAKELKIDVPNKVSNVELINLIVKATGYPSKGEEGNCMQCKGPCDPASQMCGRCARMGPYVDITTGESVTETLGAVTGSVGGEETGWETEEEEEEAPVMVSIGVQSDITVQEAIDASVRNKAVANALIEEIEDSIDEDIVDDRVSGIISDISKGRKTSPKKKKEILNAVIEDERTKIANSVIDAAERSGSISSIVADDIRDKIGTPIKSVIGNTGEEDIYDIARKQGLKQRKLEEEEPIEIPKRIVPQNRIDDIEKVLEEIKKPTKKITNLLDVERRVYECLGLIN